MLRIFELGKVIESSIYIIQIEHLFDIYIYEGIMIIYPNQNEQTHTSNGSELALDK